MPPVIVLTFPDLAQRSVDRLKHDNIVSLKQQMINGLSRSHSLKKNPSPNSHIKSDEINLLTKLIILKCLHFTDEWVSQPVHSPNDFFTKEQRLPEAAQVLCNSGLVTGLSQDNNSKTPWIINNIGGTVKLKIFDCSLFRKRGEHFPFFFYFLFFYSIKKLL